MRLFGVSLGEGNAKVGNIFTFSLPSKKTCPGASEWCLKRCYAHRYEVRRPRCVRAYEDNLALADDTKRFINTMTGVLPRIMPAMRIHVSGDFHTAAYIKAWQSICQAYLQTRFWAYTRSWAVDELLPALEELRRLPNVQLFASLDPDMPHPPKDWRAAYVKTDKRAKGNPCSQQAGTKTSCLECGYCFRKKTGDVVFKVH
ncbi:hypothetical protein ACFL1X_05405 [Candidatus Hydrogenedentota bacterium]